MKKIFIIISVTAILLSGCIDKLRNDVEDLKGRVASLETSVKNLEQKLAEGALVKSITPLAGNAGWRLEFTGGSPSFIELRNGVNGVTPHIEVRNNADGSTTVWVNSGSGWTNTGVNIKGADATPGTPGEPGEPGIDAISPKIEVRLNDDGTVTIWYNITDEYPDDEWIDTEFDLSVIGPILSVVDNAAAGTVTITMNDGVPTVYEFPKASTAVQFEIISPFKVDINQNSTGTIKFRVNPSTAWIPTGYAGTLVMNNWKLDQITTRFGYVTTPYDFLLVSILPDGGNVGQYIATIYCNNYDSAIEDYFLALVLNTNTAADPVLISSAMFSLGSGPPPSGPGILPDLDAPPYTGSFSVLPNPYSLANMQKVYNDLIGDEILQPTHNYVRFMPQDSAQYNALLYDYDLELFDYPLNIELNEDDEYIDPTIPEGSFGWLYTSTEVDFVLPPGIISQILEPCYIPEDDKTFPGRDGNSVNLELEVLKYLGFTIEPDTRAGSKPTGRITVYNNSDSIYVPVVGVKVRVHIIVKWATAYTNEQGIYNIFESINQR